MDLPDGVLHELVVAPGHGANLERRRTDRLEHAWPAKEVAAALVEFRGDLQKEQELLYANASRAVLVIFQALDAAGKDGTIAHVMSGVNPQGCAVHSFKRPSDEELRHDFLWRCAKVVPERGTIGIFNRSYYEEVLVVRVHPELLAAQRLPHVDDLDKLWHRRFRSIVDFERHLHRSGTRIVKFYLHVSPEEQRKRFLARLDQPGKQWKFNADDVAERLHFAQYRTAYEAALTATSTGRAPWYVIPADDKPLMRALVAGVLVHTLRGLHLSPPEPTPGEVAALAAARRSLEAE